MLLTLQKFGGYMSALIADLECDGFAINERVVDEAGVDLLLRELESVGINDTSMRAGKAFAIRKFIECSSCSPCAGIQSCHEVASRTSAWE